MDKRNSSFSARGAGIFRPECKHGRGLATTVSCVANFYLPTVFVCGLKGQENSLESLLERLTHEDFTLRP